MDFIRVTLIEKWDKKSKISQLRQIPEHLLPVSAIKSIHPKHTREGVYIIDIIEHFKPTDEQFEIGNAEAQLPKSFIHIVNDTLRAT